MIAAGTTKKRSSPPAPSYPATIIKRAEGRARLVVPGVGTRQSDGRADQSSQPLSITKKASPNITDIERNTAMIEPGTIILIEHESADLLEVISAEVYAVHAGDLVDVHLRGDLEDGAKSVRIRITAIGKPDAPSERDRE